MKLQICKLILFYAVFSKSTILTCSCRTCGSWNRSGDGGGFYMQRKRIENGGKLKNCKVTLFDYILTCSCWNFRGACWNRWYNSTTTADECRNSTCSCQWIEEPIAGAFMQSSFFHRAGVVSITAFWISVDSVKTIFAFETLIWGLCCRCQSSSSSCGGNWSGCSFYVEKFDVSFLFRFQF